MFVYSINLTAPGEFTCSGSANTEVGVYSVKPGPRNLSWQAMSILGKGAGLTAISGIAIRMMTVTTASTAGSAATKAPKDINSPTAGLTAISGQTISTTGRVNHQVFGCGAAGPGGWVVPNPDSQLTLPGTSAGSIDALCVSGTVSLKFEATMDVVE